MTSVQQVVTAQQMDGKTAFVVRVGQIMRTWGVFPPLFLPRAFLNAIPPVPISWTSHNSSHTLLQAPGVPQSPVRRPLSSFLLP